MVERDVTLEDAHDALDRMKRAHDRGTGCHLTAEMVAGLGLTGVGQAWEEERPGNSAGSEGEGA